MSAYTRADLKEWLRAALVRAIKTAAQVAVSLIGMDLVGFMDVDWVRVASVAGVSAVLSLLTSVAGIPEADGGDSVAQIIGDGKDA